MVNPSFVYSAYTIKDDETKRVVNFRQSSFRYFVVLIACLVVFGCQYCFDNPSALQQYIEQNYRSENNNEQLGETNFNFLYSIYSLPNIVVPLIGGMLIDTKGPRFVLVLTATICVVGQFIFGIGGFKNLFSVMLIGRFVFGIGGQVLHASQNTLISRWFKASELSMILGLCISIPKLGSSLNAILSPKIAQNYRQEGKSQTYDNVGMPIMVGLGMMIFSLIMGIILFMIDRKSEISERIDHQSKILSKKQTIKKVKNLSGYVAKMNTPKSVVMLEQSAIQQSTEVAQGHSHFDFKAIKKLPITYWILLLVSMLTQALFIPFLDNGNKYFTTVFKKIENPEDAGIYLILPYIVSSFCVIPMGYFADKIKNRGYVIIGSCTFIMFTYLFMVYVETDADLRDTTSIPWVPVFLLGVCVSIFCTIIVPTIPMIVPPQLLGSGFGMMEMVQNFGLCVFPLLAGQIRQTQKTPLQGFHLQSLTFFLFSCLNLSLAILLESLDRIKGNKLKQEDFRATYIKDHNQV